MAQRFRLSTTTGPTAIPGSTAGTGPRGRTGPTGLSSYVSVPDDHSFSGIITTLTVGTTFVFGEVGYVKSDGKLWKANAGSSGTMPVSAIAVTGINKDSSGTILLNGYVRDDSWGWTPGKMLYGSIVSGVMGATAPGATGQMVQVVAIATHADRIFFNPMYPMVEI